jgi:hypothetical protein
MSSSPPPPEPQDIGPPYLVPYDTPFGVRYARSARVRRGSRLTPLATSELVGVVVVTAALAAAISLLVIHWPEVSGLRWLAVVYPVQVVLDLAAVVRFVWMMERRSLGEWEIELAGGTLRVGRHWGPFWFDVEAVEVAHLKRLVIGKRPGNDPWPGISWDLIAEPAHGSAVTLVSAYDEPGIVLPVARDLHRRLSAGHKVHPPLPPLLEEDWPAPPPPKLPRPLLPGGPWTWLLVHAVGTAGLWQALVLAWASTPVSTRLLGVAILLVVLQGVIFLANYAYLKVSRQMRRA